MAYNNNLKNFNSKSKIIFNNDYNNVCIMWCGVNYK